MRKVSIKIKDIKIIDEKLLILDEKSEYYSPIVKGSVLCEVLTFDGKILPLSYLEIGDLIKMKLIKNKIIKIYINLKYSFISDSEDEQYL